MNKNESDYDIRRGKRQRDENNSTNNNNLNEEEGNLVDTVQNKIHQMKEQMSNINNKKADLFVRGPSSSIYAPNPFDNNNTNLFQQTSSHMFGGNFFASPMSPEYINMKPSTSSINYYNVNFKTQTDAVNQQTNVVAAKVEDSKNLMSQSIDNSETYTVNNSPRNNVAGTLINPLFPESIQPKLQNIVSTANLRCELDLREIALRAKNAEYNPKRFAAVIMRIREPKTTALIFASGKMVCTGARSEEDSKKAARQYAKIINKLGFPVKFTEFKIQNIVGSCDVKFPIRLEGLANSHSRFCSYEPEMFPGLIFRMLKPKIVLLIFVSGKIVLTGAKERNDIFNAFQNIYPLLMSFKKKEGNSQSTDMSVTGMNENN